MKGRIQIDMTVDKRKTHLKYGEQERERNKSYSALTSFGENFKEQVKPRSPVSIEHFQQSSENFQILSTRSS